MSGDPKVFALGILREEFVKFMEKLAKIPGSNIQKQQAFLRFDEGHMWMQNAIITYVEPKPQPAEPHPEEKPQGDNPPIEPINESMENKE